MNDGQKECIFTWFIENYSYCWHENGEPLVSPEFTAEGLDGTVWFLELFPRGGHYDRDYISLFLRRSEEDDGPYGFSVTHTLSFLQLDAADFETETDTNEIEKGTALAWFDFLKREEVLSEKNAEYLPHDILTVRCRIKRDDEKSQKHTQIFARSRIAIEQVSFLHTVESFSTIEPNEKKTIRSPSKIPVLSSLHFTTGSYCEEKIIMEMTSFGANQILSNCKISLVDGSGKFIECGAADNRFGDEGTDITKITLRLTKQAIMDKKYQYLPGDKLTLLCKCIFPTGVEHEIMESAQGVKCVVAQNQMIKTFQYSDIYNAAEKLSACPNALDELKGVYDDQLLTDVKLKTKTKSFPAHKILLCARSSVFKAMLTNDMKEKNTNSIQVDDLEDDTVQQLLLFLYSDSIQILQWKSAIQLYYAADKYEVEKLKVICSSFLVDNLNTSNVSELLLLSDTHNDSNLKKVAEEFMFNHEKLVYGSEEWEHLIETNPKLASKTMLEMCKRKI